MVVLGLGGCGSPYGRSLDTLRENCGIIRKQASTDGGVLWEVVRVNVVGERTVPCGTLERQDPVLEDEVLEPYVRLFRGAVGPDFIFMNDNVPCHRAVLIDDFLETENIQRMSWPANFPDLNSIEHVWDMLGRQIAAFSHPPNSVAELKSALQEA
ncbi:transposable element Tcb2 transposase [Trichonephila clavipes]|uniref:Transposable element Tcb2 transposase n=1 Tax=Trichonephila clavipes TaxID=2585209 RepID=A0A8X6V195_TRICX|nr:transposable element Tcb2 transposase [Trichonephila clavipes]